MQQQDTRDSDAIFSFFASMGIFAVVFGLAIWGMLALIAWYVAPADRQWTFFWLTLLILGPLGILAASVASPRDLDYFADAIADGVEEALNRPR